MKKYFAYIRVSTVKQGEHGVSLQEQQDAIERYAQRFGLELVGWFEERQTAAKRGRPVFTRMLRLLTTGKADGVVIHKIDRSARNLKDWADLGELIDHGLEVHFANEGLDLHSRGGRLSADIQAVVAADYIRNLREETRKGFYGRLKQGFYPLPAPLGYLDQGRAKVKILDPVKAPLVRQVFELYATAQYNLDGLAEEMWRRGLRNRRGGRVTRTGLSMLLNKPFYMGLIRLRRTGELFSGGHEPLVSKALFDRVQAILTGKVNARSIRHDLLFRRILTCRHCGRSLIGEIQKKHVYYRCQTRGCPTTTIREETVDHAFRSEFARLCFTAEESAYVDRKIAEVRERAKEGKISKETTLTQSLEQLDARLERLTDAVIERLIDQPTFAKRQNAFLVERKALEDELTALRQGGEPAEELAQILERAKTVYLTYEIGVPSEKREILRSLTSNRTVNGRTLEIMLRIPFGEIARRFETANGAPSRDIPRTWDRLLERLMEFIRTSPATAS